MFSSLYNEPKIMWNMQRSLDNMQLFQPRVTTSLQQKSSLKRIISLTGHGLLKSFIDEAIGHKFDPLSSCLPHKEMTKSLVVTYPWRFGIQT